MAKELATKSVAAKKQTVRKVYVYFVQDGNDGLIKIGQTTSVKKRLAGLRTMSPTRLNHLGTMLASGRFNEASLHARFKHLRQHGEWFTPGLELLDFIESHASPFDESKNYPHPIAMRSPEEVADGNRRGAVMFAFLMHSMGVSKEEACFTTNGFSGRHANSPEISPDDIPDYVPCPAGRRRAGRAVKLALASLASPA